MAFFGLAGCQQGGVRADMEDDTGSLGTTAKKGTGDVYVRLAVVYMQQGKLGVALQNIKKGIAADPNNGEGHNVMAIIYNRLGEKGLAEKHFKQSKRLQPRNPYTLNAYGGFLCSEKRFKEADEQFKSALKNPLYKTPEVALTNAGICARRAKDLDVAEAYLRRALQHNNRFSVALLNMARISHESGDMQAARDFIKRYHKVAKFTAQSLWLAIQIETKLGNKDAVASHIMQLRGSFPDSTEVKLLRDSLK
ncbi:MAG: type IV pilus biogenesis/stability protein PilW [Gammaproteobacteria bacterium]|nr:type IV pilus biogenesis/stability protein PilW [Gammaproteobacteria bacterium]